MSASDQPIVHTPGWTIEPHGNGYALYSGRGPMTHGMNLVYMSEPDRNWESTKRLIEAAPDLLAACQAFLEADNQCGANLAFVMAQEAIRKAGVAPKENGGETCDMKHGPCSCGATH